MYEEGAVDYMVREEVSISAMPGAFHLPVSVTSYYTDSGLTCVIEYGV